MSINHKPRLSPLVIVSSFFVYMVGVAITFLVGLAMVLFLWPFRHRLSADTIDQWVTFWAKANLKVLKIFSALDYEVHGIQHLTKIMAENKGFVVVSNHQSAFEIVVFVALFKRVTFIAKESLLSVPIFGWAMSLMKPVAINRKDTKNAMKSLLEQGKKRLADNHTFVSYPEGKRLPKGIIGEYKAGGLLLAAKNKAMVLPVVHDSGVFWARKSPWRFPGKMQLVIGEPIDSSQYTPRQLTYLIEQWSRKQLTLIGQGKAQPNLKIK